MRVKANKNLNIPLGENKTMQGFGFYSKKKKKRSKSKKKFERGTILSRSRDTSDMLEHLNRGKAGHFLIRFVLIV